MANAPAQATLGLTLSAALGEEIANVVPDVALADLIYRVTLGGGPVTGEVRDAQGCRRVARVSPLPGGGSITLLQDASALPNATERKREMFRITAHDLKNTLAAIKGYTDLIVRVDELTEKQHFFVERVRMSAIRMIEQMKDLLEVAWIEAAIEVHRERTNLLALVWEVVTEHGEAAEDKGVTVSVSDDGDAAHVLGDPEQLRLMVDKMVDYAIRASQEGGSVAVSLRTEGGQAVCVVQVAGPKILGEYRDRVFDRYFRFEEDAVRLGVDGLELALVKAIVEQHAGTVRVESAAGEGNAFVIKLPAAV